MATFLSVFLVMNVFLFFFNLLPLSSVDGAAVLNGLMPSAMLMRSWSGNRTRCLDGGLAGVEAVPLITI